MSYCKVAVAVSALALLPSLLFAETIRGPLRGEEAIATASASAPIELGIDELLGVSLSKENRFIDGIEVVVQIPASVRQYPNLIALFIYKNVRPAPATGTVEYTGTRAAFVVLPATSRAYIDIPIREGTVPGSAATTTIPSIVHPGEFPLILSILPITKGLPSQISESTFSVSVVPILADRGLLKLDVTENGGPPKEPYSLSIDNQPVTPTPNGYVLPSGLHRLQITSDSYKSIYRTFGIDKGQTTSIALQLQSVVPRLSFEAPDTAEVFLDGRKLDPVPRTPIDVSVGEHTVVVRVGNYSLTKKFAVDRGKSYKISLFLDILVQEN